MENKYYDYDDNDFYVEKKMSHLRQERNIFLAMGFVAGILSTLFFGYVYMWATLGH